MAGKIEIINVALARIGANEIESLTDGTQEQKLAVNLWDMARRACLRDHTWNFAVADVELSPVVGYTPFEFDYAYQIPSNSLRILQVYQNPVFKLQGRQLLTDQAICKIKYVTDVTDTTVWDSMFADVMAQRLAADMGFALTKSQATADSMYAIYDRKLKQARHIDSTEDTMDMLGGEESIYISARY
jgi:hypothetical protein